MNIRDIITASGGPSKFARLHGIPLRTVQDWYYDKHRPAEWLVRLIEKVTPTK